MKMRLFFLLHIFLLLRFAQIAPFFLIVLINNNIFRGKYSSIEKH